MTMFRWRDRRSIRLPGYDYSIEGAYFATIVTYQREWLFGVVRNGEMVLNDMGRIVKDEWEQTPEKRHNVDIDEFIVMPNHMHFILWINDCRRGVLQYAPTGFDRIHTETKLQSPSQTIGAIVRGFKSASTKRINELLHSPGNPVWQRNYYERIIRNDEELKAIRQYICDNPRNWESDEDNCKHIDSVRRRSMSCPYEPSGGSV